MPTDADQDWSAAAPDVLELYRWAVQDPETHAEVLRLMYERVRGGSPIVLREDFAGTCSESVAWVAMRRGRRAVAVDLDGPTLGWAERRAALLLGDRAGAVRFVRGDSLEVGPPEVEPADVISVLNFSVLYLRDAETLGRYLRHARACLAPEGLLVMNVFGGPAALRVGTTRHTVTPAPRMRREASRAPFEYDWEVRSYDPRSGRLDCRIHFQADGREIRDAFRYEWRLWSIDDLLRACRGAGFADARVWRHTYDASKGAAGVFLGPVEPEAVAGLDRWTAYIVAVK
jgi:SAM-dependent methyltransferase